MGMCAGAPPGREPLLAAGADALDRPQLAFPQPTFMLPAYVGGIYKCLKKTVGLIHSVTKRQRHITAANEDPHSANPRHRHTRARSSRSAACAARALRRARGPEGRPPDRAGRRGNDRAAEWGAYSSSSR